MFTDVWKDRSPFIFRAKQSKKGDFMQDIKNGHTFWNEIRKENNSEI
jgi:hypothetical protein